MHTSWPESTGTTSGKPLTPEPERGIWGSVVWRRRSVSDLDDQPERDGRWATAPAECVGGCRGASGQPGLRRRAAQTSAQATTASLNTLTAAITIPRKVLTPAA